MSIFGNMMSKIFGHARRRLRPEVRPPPLIKAEPAQAQRRSSAAGREPAQSGQSTSSAQASQNVDVAAVLDGLAAKNPQKLDWKHSIVDMMKLLDMDSSLSARKELASELHYSGDTNDSAAMNIWLHKQVMQKLAENGGKVPDELKH